VSRIFRTTSSAQWIPPNATQLRVEADQAGNVGFGVLECIDVALGSSVNELPVESLPTALLVKDPFSADLISVVQPSRESAGQTADGCSGEGGDRRDDGGVHRWQVQTAAESVSGDYRVWLPL
jgi:hypothetical protein